MRSSPSIPDEVQATSIPSCNTEKSSCLAVKHRTKLSYMALYGRETLQILAVGTQEAPSKTIRDSHAVSATQLSTVVCLNCCQEWSRLRYKGKMVSPEADKDVGCQGWKPI